MERVDSCCDGHELFRIAKQRVGEKKDVGVSCLTDENWGLKVWMIERKSGKRMWKSLRMLKMNGVITLMLVR